MNSVPVQMEVDTGATVSLMSCSTFLATWPERTIQLEASEAKLRTYTGEKIATKGSLRVTVSYQGQSAQFLLTIVEGEGPTLLGRDCYGTCG